MCDIYDIYSWIATYTHDTIFKNDAHYRTIVLEKVVTAVLGRKRDKGVNYG